jgi:hypothetical protein
MAEIDVHRVRNRYRKHPNFSRSENVWLRAVLKDLFRDEQWMPNPWMNPRSIRDGCAVVWMRMQPWIY